MKKTLETIGLSFLKAFGAAMIIVVTGPTPQPPVGGVGALYLSGAIAGLAAGIATLQLWIPALTFHRWISDPVGKLLDTFSHGFLAAFAVSAIGFLHAQDLTISKAAVSAALIGALAAGFRAIQGAATIGEKPLPNDGVLTPLPAPVLPVIPPQVPAPAEVGTAVSVAPVAAQPVPNPPLTM